MPIPADTKKIRERIRRYERKWKNLDFDDGAGSHCNAYNHDSLRNGAI